VRGKVKDVSATPRLYYKAKETQVAPKFSSRSHFLLTRFDNAKKFWYAICRLAVRARMQWFYCMLIAARV
jgi:hypothetical protein